MKTHKFARKPFYVDAVRVTEDNMSEVAAWCQGEVLVDEEDTSSSFGQKYVKVRVHRPLTDRQTMAFIGDWILHAGTGFKVYTPKAFDKSFEKVKTLTKAQADEAGIKVPHEPRQKPRRPKPQPPKGLTQKVGDAVDAAKIKVGDISDEVVETVQEKIVEPVKAEVDPVKELLEEVEAEKTSV